MIVFEAAFDVERDVGDGFRPAASRPTERNGMRPWSLRRMVRCPLGLNRVPDRLLRRVEAIPKKSGCANGLEMGAPHIFWTGGGTTSPPIEEVGPAIAFDAAFDGKQCVGARFRSAGPCPSQSKESRMHHENGAHPDVVGQTAARRRLSLRESVRRMFSMQNLKPSKEWMPASDRRRLSPINPKQMACALENLGCAASGMKGAPIPQGPTCGEMGERGATLLEAAFVVTLFGSLLVLANMLLSDELERRRSISLGLDLRLTSSAAQSFVALNYEALIERFAGLGDGEAIYSVSMQELASAGFLPAEFIENGERRNSYGQRYSLLLRGVNRSDAASPKSTMAVAALDADADGNVDPALRDGDPSNGELDLEVVLVTTDGDPVVPTIGNPAIIASEMASAGYIQNTGVANGPYGSWQLDISPFSSLDDYPAEERFAFLVALSGAGVLRDGQFALSGAAGHPLERCVGATRDRLADCAMTNEVHGEIAFGGPADAALVSEGLNTISNVYSIEMGPPVDSSGNGSVDLHSVISGLAELGCGAGTSNSFISGTLMIDCADVRFAGNAEVVADLAVGGDLEIEGGINAGSAIEAEGGVSALRFVAGAIGDEDLTKGVYFADVVAMGQGSEIAKPVCEDENVEPQVYAVPAAFGSPNGVPLVGVRAYAAESGDGSKWLVHMKAIIDKDGDSDGLADIVELNSSDDYALVLTKCG